MGLHKTSMVHGIGAYLEQRGLIGWASEKVASEVYEHIAGQLQGPEQLPAAGLDPVSAYKIAQVITDTHANLARQGFGGDRSLAMQKQAAASNDVETLAIMTAGGLMQKRADAMIMQGGQHTNRAGESPDTLAQLDQMQRPQGQYLTGVGHTDMPDGPSSWSSQPHPIGHTNTVPVSNSITKQAWAGAANELVHFPSAVARTAWDGMGPTAQAALAGGAGGAVLGGAGGALASDEGDRLRGGLLGGLGGAAVGAGLGAGGSVAYHGDNAVGRAMRSPGAALGDAGSWMAGKADGARSAIVNAGNQVADDVSNAAFWNGNAAQRTMGNIGDSWNGMSLEARNSILGGAGGAALGGAGGAYADDDNRLRGALIGAGAGGALGAGGSYLATHGIEGKALPGMRGGHDSGPMNPAAGRFGYEPSGGRPISPLPTGPAPMPGANNGMVNVPHDSGPMNPFAAEGNAARDALNAGELLSYQQKGASDISSLLRKIASGGSLTHSPKNTASDAAKHDELAALDLKNRAEGKYVGVAGHSSFPNVNQDFHVQSMPGAPKTGPSTVSSREIKSASDMSQDEQIFVHLFNKTASEIGPYLPSNMDVDTKVAHIRAAIGLDNAQRISYLNAIYGQR